MTDKKFRRICLRCIIFVGQLIAIIAGMVCCLIIISSNFDMGGPAIEKTTEEATWAFLGIILSFCTIGFTYSNLGAIGRDFKKFLNDNLN